MKNERTNQWARWLQTTPMKQGTGALHKVDPETGSHLFCCLGLGVEKSQAYDRKEEQESSEEYDREGEPIRVFAYDGADGLPNGAFYQWLGFNEDDLAGAGYNSDQDDAGLDCYLLAGWVVLLHPLNGERLGQHTLAAINDDWGLTFPQIGDLIAYFGISLRSVAS